MAKKKAATSNQTERAIVPVNQSSPTVHRFGEALVRVDAIYHVRSPARAATGPWTGEADKIAWTDPLSGYACIIRRDGRRGHLCGFVAVPPGHPFFGRRAGTLTGYRIGVHGGIDYAATCRSQEPEETSICHISGQGLLPGHSHGPRPGHVRGRVFSNRADRPHDEAWWFGFSCNHPGDALPTNGAANQLLSGVKEAVYKDERYVYRECIRLAAQLKAVEEGRSPAEADPGATATAYDPGRIGA